MNSRYTSSEKRYRSYFFTRSRIWFISRRVTNEDGACALVDEFLEFLHFWQGETFLYGSSDGANDGASRNGKCHVVGVCWFGHDDFVAWIEAGKERKEHSLGTTTCDNDVVGSEIDIEFLVVSNQFLAIAAIALTWAVFQNLSVDILDGIDGDLRRWQVGLSDVEMVNVDSSALGILCQWR